MDGAGCYALTIDGGDFAVTVADVYTGVWVTGLDGMQAMSVSLDFRYGTSDMASIRAYVQTSLDDGATAFDVACLVFNTVSDRRAFNLSGTSAAGIVSASDGFLADNTLLNGLLGNRVRLKLATTGTYQNTVLAGRINVR